MRTTLVAGAVVVACGVAVFAAQDEKKPAHAQDMVVLSGCLHGSLLTVDSSVTNAPETFQLQGSKGLMKTLKQHDGDRDEVTGRIVGPRPTSMRRSKQITKKTRVFAGAGESEAATSDDLAPRRLQIESLRHTGDVCRS
ncbi:MAG TPA: hypothetical protein VFX12_09300 [Vicinamibacterales bacterium]|nr:hypothetical protein [Vicinamibacterales bacterium]